MHRPSRIITDYHWLPDRTYTWLLRLPRMTASSIYCGRVLQTCLLYRVSGVCFTVSMLSLFLLRTRVCPYIYVCLHTQWTHCVLHIRACNLHSIARGPLSFIWTITCLLLRFTSIYVYLNHHHELVTEPFSIASYYLYDTSSIRSPMCYPRCVACVLCNRVHDVIV